MKTYPFFLKTRQKRRTLLFAQKYTLGTPHFQYIEMAAFLDNAAISINNEAAVTTAP